MGTVYMSNADKGLSNDAITGVENANGAPDGSYATATLSEDGASIVGDADLSAATLSGLSVALTAGRTGGTGGINVNSVAFLDGNSTDVLGYSYAAFGSVTISGSVATITVALTGLTPSVGELSLAALNSIRKIKLDVTWDAEGSDPEVSIDSIAVTWEAAATYPARIASSRLSTDRLSGDRLSLSRL